MVAAVDELLAKRVSFQGNVWSPPSEEPSVQQVLDDIRLGRYHPKVRYLRGLISRGDWDRYSVEKTHLPGVTFSGTFGEKRQVQQLKKYNDLVVLDIDHLSKEGLLAASTNLRQDNHVLACWVSPSEAGLKGLVGLSFPQGERDGDAVTRHRAAFAQLSSYFKGEYGISLDQSGSDITRLCFLSSDPNLHFRADAACFAVAEIPAPAEPVGLRSAAPRGECGSPRLDRAGTNSLNRTEGKNRSRDRDVVGAIVRYLEKRTHSITATHERWVRVALAIADTFTYDVGKRYFLRLCRLDGAGHDEDGSIRLLESWYYSSRGQITLGTIRRYAKEAGYDTRRRCDRGQH
jgi:hypothetical protein